MKKIYLDTNVITEAQKRWAGHEFESMLNSKGFQPSIGTTVIYELARGFLSEEFTETGKEIFLFLDQMEDPHYVPERINLINDELIKAKTGAQVLYVMNELDRIATKQEIWRLAHGYTENATKFIEDRESKERMESFNLSQKITELFNEFIESHPNKLHDIKTFVKFKDTYFNLKAALGDCLSKIGFKGVPDSILRRILTNQDEYPTINTWLNCQLYLNYIPAVHRDVPSRSRLDDFCHVIACCASDLFVSKDERLISNFSDLNPFRECKLWKDFEASLRKGK